MAKAAKEKKPRKPGSGGSRRKKDPVRGEATGRMVSLYDDEVEALKAKYGSLTKAIRTLI